jgi:biotin/methionine sulfoxide reductase
MAETTTLTATHWGTYRISTESGKLVAVEGWEGDPAPSPIGQSLSAVEGPLRIARPAIRQGWLENGPIGTGAGRGVDPFVQVSWEEALDLVTTELARVRREHGNEAIYGGSYGWASAGRFHHAQSQLHRFLNLIGGYTASVQTYSWAAGEIILPHVIGNTDGLTGYQSTWSTIVEHGRLIVAFGGLPLRNSQVQAGGVGRHIVKEELAAASRRGVRMVSISPVPDDAPAGIEAERIWLRPNTDVAVMLGIAYTLIVEDLHDEGFLARFCVGFDRLRDYILGGTDGIAKTPEWAEAISGVEADRITTLARDMAAGPTIVIANWALQRGDHGEQPYWMTIALASLLGQIGLPGGGFGFGYGATNGMGRPELGFKWPALPQGRNPVSTFIPVARISDLLLRPGEECDFNGRRLVYPDIRLVYWAGGNPFHHHQDLNRFVAAWRRPDTVICHEQFWNPLACYSDIVLPVTTSLERNDIAFANRENVVVAMKKAIEPVAEARSDFAIFCGMAERMGVAGSFSGNRGEMEWLRDFYDEARETASAHGVAMPDFETFWEAGALTIERPVRSHVLLSAFQADPAANPLKTPSGRIELYSETIASFGYDDCVGHPAWFEPDEWLGSPLSSEYPLHILSCQPGSKLHSQYDHGVNSLREKVQGRAPIRLNPQDAARRGIKSSDVVRVFNARGACLAGAVLDDAIKPGIVVLATGAWYDPDDPAAPMPLDKHGNPNVLTIDKGTSRLAQAPIVNTVLVEVERFQPPVPPVTAFVPPTFVRLESPIR